MTSGQRSNAGLKKGPWSGEEDALLINYVIRHGEVNWNADQRLTGLARCGRSCRLRWHNHLRLDLKKGEFTPDEEAAVARLHLAIGNKWSLIAAQLPGRSDNKIKNYWNTRVKRRQRAGLPLYSPEIPDLHAPPTAMPVSYGLLPVMPPQTELLPTYYATTELPSDEMGTEAAGTPNGGGTLDTNPVIQDDKQTLIDMLATPTPPAPIPDWYNHDGGGGDLEQRSIGTTCIGWGCKQL